MRVNTGIGPVVAVVQARMGSTRLPGKVMKPLGGRPILWHVVNRLKSASMIDDIVVATTDQPSDDVIKEWCGLNGTGCYRGSQDDVLDRYFYAARNAGAKTVVRITSDCPLVDPALVDRAIRKFSEGGFDYVSLDPSFPDGLDAEVFSFEALEKAYMAAALSSEREHVTPYIWKRTQLFRVCRIMSETDLSHMRWTVDDERDLKLVTAIYGGIDAGERVFHMDEVLRFLEKNPALLGLNAAIERNEGYAKSLKEDKLVQRAG